MQRAGVKIADKITDLNENFTWTLDEYFTGKYDVLLAVIEERKEGPLVIIRQLLQIDSSPETSRLQLEDDD